MIVGPFLDILKQSEYDHFKSIKKDDLQKYDSIPKKLITTIETHKKKFEASDLKLLSPKPETLLFRVEKVNPELGTSESLVYTKTSRNPYTLQKIKIGERDVFYNQFSLGKINSAFLIPYEGDNMISCNIKTREMFIPLKLYKKYYFSVKQPEDFPSLDETFEKIRQFINDESSELFVNEIEEELSQKIVLKIVGIDIRDDHVKFVFDDDSINVLELLMSYNNKVNMSSRTKEEYKHEPVSHKEGNKTPVINTDHFVMTNYPFVLRIEGKLDLVIGQNHYNEGLLMYRKAEKYNLKETSNSICEKLYGLITKIITKNSDGYESGPVVAEEFLGSELFIIDSGVDDIQNFIETNIENLISICDYNIQRNWLRLLESEYCITDNKTFVTFFSLKSQGVYIDLLCIKKSPERLINGRILENGIIHYLEEKKIDFSNIYISSIITNENTYKSWFDKGFRVVLEKIEDINDTETFERLDVESFRSKNDKSGGRKRKRSANHERAEALIFSLLRFV